MCMRVRSCEPYSFSWMSASVLMRFWLSTSGARLWPIPDARCLQVEEARDDLEVVLHPVVNLLEETSFSLSAAHSFSSAWRRCVTSMQMPVMRRGSPTSAYVALPSAAIHRTAPVGRTILYSLAREE